MATNRYFRFGGQPKHHMSNWHGMSPAAVRRGSRELGEANFYESSGPPITRYRPLSQSRMAHARGQLAEHLREDDLSGPPMRPSGPEPLDPGEMPEFEAGYPAEPFAMSVGAEEPLPSPGFMGLSRNESRLVLIGGAAALGYLFWKSKKKRA
jgi:hypothetical protein